jgi:hypothetical protein
MVLSTSLRHMTKGGQVLRQHNVGGRGGGVDVLEYYAPVVMLTSLRHMTTGGQVLRQHKAG